MNKPIAILTGSLLVVGLMIYWMVINERSASRSRLALPSRTDAQPNENDNSTTEVILLCAASNQAAIEAIRKQYEAECGRRVSVQYGNSQSLLSQLEVSKRGDLFLPADDSFMEFAQEKGLIAERLPVASMQVGLAVAKGNPKQIKTLSDLTREDVRLVQAAPEAAAVGRITKNHLEKLGKWEGVKHATEAFRSTVSEVATDVILGAADVGIVYDAVLYPFPELEFVQVEEFSKAVSQISIGVSRGTENSPAALHFARYVTAMDRGLQVYREQGFGVGQGDVWEDVPDLTIYAGSMLRPAIEDSIIEFEKREGVKVSRSYNGCGILVAQMKAGQIPDAYFACDKEFMSQVTDVFPEATTVSQNELVILVPKGNPNKITSLRDLTTPGLRVGIGHEKQCAMGWVTQNTLRESGIQNELMANVTVQTPTGDMLVNQLRTGSLDAAVAYLSNAAGAAQYLDAIQIKGISCSTAEQPWGVAKTSKFPLLADRLFKRICSEESQEIFIAEGFRWHRGEKVSNQPNFASPAAAIPTDQP